MNSSVWIQLRILSYRPLHELIELVHPDAKGLQASCYGNMHRLTARRLFEPSSRRLDRSTSRRVGGMHVADNNKFTPS